MSETPTAQAFTDHSLRLAQIANPQSEIVHFPAHEPLKLDCGVELAPFSIAYQTYGVLNAAKSNVVLVCHALTGDQHVANIHPVTGKPGWWDTMVGPGKPIDTNRYFVLCANVIGGCMGSTGPASPMCCRCSAARWAACRCWNGPRPTRIACSPPCRLLAPRATPRRTSPSMRSVARR